MAELGFDLSKAYWGKGLMREALEAVIGFGFSAMGLSGVEATVEPENERSLHLLKRMGFRKELELRDGLVYTYLSREQEGQTMYMKKPDEGEFIPYWGHYIDAVEEGDLLQLLAEQERKLVEIYGAFSEEQSLYRYDVEKWSLKEVLGHIIDTERIMSYRLLCIARGDKTPLPRHGDIYVNGTSFDRRPLNELLAEFHAVRASALALVQGLTQDELLRTGVVNNAPTSAVAVVYFMIGHALHHMNVVSERYVPRI